MSDTSKVPTPNVNPHLTGSAAPVRSEDDFDLKVRGRIPEGLRGALYRNGPNPQFDPGPAYHPFIGDGMIHAFFLDGQRARYRNRWVRTPRWLAENAAGRPLFGGMGAPSDPSVENILGGTANTNIVHHAGKLLALQEGSDPFEMDKATLDSRGFLETGGRFTAHPKIDPETGELVWFAYSAGEGRINRGIAYGVTDATGRITRRDLFEAPYCSMVHDFMVTRHHALFPILPLTGDFDRASRGGPIFAWEPEKGAYVGVLKRDAGVETIRWFEVAPNYVFHPMNGWEDGDKIHCDMMEYPSAPLFPRADGSRGSDTTARLVRWTIDLGAATNEIRRVPLDDLAGEFPRFDERFAGLPYRHGWFAANGGGQAVLATDSLAHIDHRTGKRSVRRFSPGDAVGEPIFVPKSPDAPEGDGWILAVIYRAAEDRSDLLILDAQNIEGEPAAVIEVPRRVPSGFHGNWVGA